MTGKTKIEWTDKTWNPIVGCSIISPGCTNCYAMKTAGNRLDGNPKAAHYAGTTMKTKAGPVWTGKVEMAPDHILTAPLRWRKPQKIFVNSMGDLFHVEILKEDVARIFGICIASYHLNGHTFQILTKRSEQMRLLLNDPEFWEITNWWAEWEVMERVNPLNRRSTDARATLRDYGPQNPPPFIWLGVSTEDQARADERIPHLLETPAAVRFISAEPLLGPIDLNVAWHGEDALDAECWGECAWCEKGFPPLHNCQKGNGDWERGKSGLDWVICGGESGPGARPMHPDWVRSLRNQCVAAGVPFFFKQWGEWAPGMPPQSDVKGRFALQGPHSEGQWQYFDYSPRHIDRFGSDARMTRIGKKAAGHLLDGVAHRAFPEVAT